MYNNNRRSFGGPRRRGFGGGGRHRTKSLHPSLLIKKAELSAEPEVYQPENLFADFPFAPKIQQNIEFHGYKEPTPIQDQAIPALLDGKDVVGIANTGTGKTAAFLLPLINKIAQDRNEKVLIIAPTRELAVQIQKEAQAFTRDMGIYTLLCIGGVSLHPQIQGLRRGPHIVIGTPGRLKDLNNQRYLDFNKYRSIVLDEVDRMLDMGFIQDIRYIIDRLPQERQSLFFSATLSPSVRSVMNDFLHNPVTISVKSQETASNVDQDIVKVGGQPKITVLSDLLKQAEVEKVIIFGRTKRGIEKLAEQLYARGFDIEALHGDKSQNQRQRALEAFRRNKVSILLATDVAARGLDIADVTHVINYDLPETYDEYVHRIGRTGRAGKKGYALSFID